MNRVRGHLLRLAARVRAATGRRDSYGYLPAILELLEEMERCLQKGRPTRERLSRGLGRLVMESVEFSESRLGSDLVRFADEYEA